MNQTTFIVGARLADGTTGRWHVPADSHESAAVDVANVIGEPKPIVILTCITGSKSNDK